MVLSSISLPVTTFSSHFALFLSSLSCHLSFSLHPFHSQSRSSHGHSSQSRCIPSLSLSQRSPNLHSFQSPSHSKKFISMLLLFIFTFYFVCLLSHTSMTADLTECESSLSNNSLSFNCSNRSSLIYCNNACIFLPDRYSFLRTTTYPENITIVVILSRLWEIEDIGQPTSTFLILKVSIFFVFFCFKIFLRCIGMNCSSVNYKDNRFFIRKNLKSRKRKKMCSVGHIFLITHLLIKEEEKFKMSSHNTDFFTVEFIRFIKLNWESNLSFYSISFLLTKRYYFKKTQDYLWILLFLSGDLELNPGPFNYQLSHPNLCGYYRTGIFSVLKRMKLIPQKDKDGNNIIEHPTYEEGLNDLKSIFGNHYFSHELEW